MHLLLRVSLLAALLAGCASPGMQTSLHISHCARAVIRTGPGAAPAGTRTGTGSSSSSS